MSGSTFMSYGEFKQKYNLNCYTTLTIDAIPMIWRKKRCVVKGDFVSIQNSD